MVYRERTGAAEEFAARYGEAVSWLARLGVDRYSEWWTGMWLVLVVAACRPPVEYPRLEAIWEAGVAQSPLARREEQQAMAVAIRDYWKAQGLELGTVQGAQAMLLGLLEQRLGGCSPAVRAAVQELETLAELQAAQGVALQAGSEGEFLTGLAVPRNGHGRPAL